MFDKFQSSSPAPQLSASTPFSSKRYAWSLKFSLLFSLCVDRSTEPAGSFVLLLSIPDTTSSLAMRAELLPHLCSRYKALPPSVYLRPKFRQCMWGELSESSVPWGKKRKGGRRCIYLFKCFCTLTQALIFITFFSLMWITWSWPARIKTRILCFYWKLWWLTMNWVAWCLSNGLCKW